MKGLRESTKNVIKKLKEETEYQKFFAKALKKYGKSSPAEMSDDEKKEFFDYVDRNWKGAHEESVEEAAENWKGRALRVGKSHVIEILPEGGKLYNKKGISTLLSKEELYSFAKQIKEKNIPITEGLHMFSGNINITKKRVLPLLKKMGISKIKVKSVGGMFLDVYFDADNEKFKEIQKVFAKNFGKQGSSSWKNLNMSLESDSLDEFGKMHVLKLSKQQLKGMILRAKRAGARRYDIIKSMSRDLSASPDEVVSALEKNGLIRMTERITEAEVDGSEFMKKWNKALSKAKSAGMYSPHMKGDAGKSHGYTMSDFWGKVPDKISDNESIPVFGYHRQSAQGAFKQGMWAGELGLTWGQTKDAGKKIVKAMKSAGFKVDWNGNTNQKIGLKVG